ncbi:MAG: hypothetical protein FWC55_02420 [Firmicutes bacterium]|nr:hypothetical protein [Bacillota bacterium]
MTAIDVLVIVGIALAAVLAGLYFLNKWASKRMAAQQEMIERNKQTVSIYVIDKKKEKASDVNLPKAVTQNMPRASRLMKMPFVKAKVGPQIVTLMCEKKVYDALPVKKNVKVELAGMYIVGMKGLKTKREMQELARARRGGEAPLKWNEKLARAVDPRRIFGRERS